MALTFNGVKVDIADNLLPSDYTKPTVTTFNDHKYTRRLTVASTKSGVENVDPATTVAAVVADIDTQAQALLNTDFDTTVLAVDAYAVVRVIGTNLDNLALEKYSNVEEAYQSVVDIYIKTP